MYKVYIYSKEGRLTGFQELASGVILLDWSDSAFLIFCRSESGWSTGVPQFFGVVALGVPSRQEAGRARDCIPARNKRVARRIE